MGDVHDLDYDKLGLKCGLEIHQQIKGRKLFCACPCLIRDDTPDRTVRRKLRAAAGETGTTDIAARHEAKKDKTYVYEWYQDTTCLVELDEEPPHALNEDALRVVLEFCSLTHAKVVDQVHVMRKTVVDGSNTSAFQRTALVARNGSMNVLGKTIHIPTICLEEDAARIISRTTDETVYRLDRLGIPLIEIATSPDIHSPEECKAVAAEIGMYLRSTGKVMRGLGTIRQDVNVSIKEGCRVEIKGAQDLRMLPTLVEYEARRQHNLVQLFKELKKAKAHVIEVQDVTPLFKNTEGKIIRTALDKNGLVLGFKLVGFAGYLGKEVQPGRRLGTEYSDHAKLMGAGGLFHSDELPHYGITAEEIDAVRNALHCTPKDGFIIIADETSIAHKAIATVHARASVLDLQEEVRQANPDGTSSFLRPMPGSSRMYPETDILPFSVEEHIPAPELLSAKIKEYQKTYDLSADLATAIVDNELDVSGFTERYPKLKPAFIFDTLLSGSDEINRLYPQLSLTTAQLCSSSITAEVLRSSNDGIIPPEKSVLFDVIGKKLSGIDVQFAAVSDEEVIAALQKIIADNKNASPRAMMGKAMGQFRGKVSGKKIAEMLKQIM